MQQLVKQLKQQQANKLPFVAYKKPNEDSVIAVFQQDDTLHTVNDFTEKGFVFAPFDADKKTILIPFDKIVTTPYTYIKQENHEVVNTIFDKKKHLDLLDKTIANLQTDDYSKIVISRVEKLEMNTVDAIALFQQLLALYTTAFVYVWHHPKVGTWLGATPETLLQTRGNRFKTMALAGTQKYNEHLIWGEKEKQEQAMVTDFIVQNLQPVVTSLNVGETHTVKAADLAHLRTDITGNFESQKLGDIIKTLHPTPAVCGLPTQKAKDFIQKNEDYNRDFYTGFLGELNKPSSRSKNKRNTENKAYHLKTATTNLFVNLRCMQVANTTISIYVGGGITAASNAELEYQETVHKLNTMGVLFTKN